MKAENLYAAFVILNIKLNGIDAKTDTKGGGIKNLLEKHLA